MQIEWRHAIGPALTTALAGTAVAVDGGALAFPAMAPLLVFSTALGAAIGGSGAGLVSAAIAVGIGIIALPDTQDRVMQLTTLAAASGAAAAITGRLRERMTNASSSAKSCTQSWQRHKHETAERLSAALDRVDIGVVLLDPDTRAAFTNRAFRDFFALPVDKAETQPPFIALMYHGRDVGAFDMPDDEIAHYIAERTEQVRSGDPTPLHLKLTDGRVLRVSCAALPDGSRMMSYAPLNDSVRRYDDPAHRPRYLAMRRLPSGST